MGAASHHHRAPKPAESEPFSIPSNSMNMCDFSSNIDRIDQHTHARTGRAGNARSGLGHGDEGRQTRRSSRLDWVSRSFERIVNRALLEKPHLCTPYGPIMSFPQPKSIDGCQFQGPTEQRIRAWTCPRSPKRAEARRERRCVRHRLGKRCCCLPPSTMSTMGARPHDPKSPGIRGRTPIPTTPALPP